MSDLVLACSNFLCLSLLVSLAFSFPPNLVQVPFIAITPLGGSPISKGAVMSQFPSIELFFSQFLSHLLKTCQRSKGKACARGRFRNIFERVLQPSGLNGVFNLLEHFISSGLDAMKIGNCWNGILEKVIGN